jgi:TetR/AcrR family transcriptional repressor of mexJK operon
MSSRNDRESADESRSARKRRAIVEAATALFLRDGYRSTSMDQVAADAAVSKQTVYKQFNHKEQLFREIVLGVTGRSEAIVADLTSALDGEEPSSIEELEPVLVDLARRLIDGVLQPNVLALRRLVIAEAEQFPDLARTYYDQAPSRGITVLADALRAWERRRLLAMPDPRLAATHLAYLALGQPLDRAQFRPEDRLAPAERDRLAAEAVRVFLAAYGA